MGFFFGEIFISQKQLISVCRGGEMKMIAKKVVV